MPPAAKYPPGVIGPASLMYLRRWASTLGKQLSTGASTRESLAQLIDLRNALMQIKPSRAGGRAGGREKLARRRLT